MFSPRPLRNVTLLVMCLTAFNVGYTLTSWCIQHKALPLREYALKSSSEITKTKKQAEEVTSTFLPLLSLSTSEINSDNYKEIQPDTPKITTEGTAETTPLQNEGSKKLRQLLCPEIPPGLGPISKTLPLDVSEIVSNSTSPGGYFKFNGCKPRQRIAIIIPIRESQRNVSYTFLFHLHSFLIKQQVEYRVFIVGQNNSKQTFIRGRLINVGFTEIRQRFKNIHCFVIQDLNIVSLDTRNLYRCSWQPRQLAVTIERNDKSTFVPKFGHTVALTDEQFSKANGFSNLNWAHNSDYDYMLQRLQAVSYTLEKCPFTYGKFAYLFDETDVSKLVKINHPIFPTDLLDGIATLSYIVACYEERDYYTYISVHFPEDVHNIVTES